MEKTEKRQVTDTDAQRVEEAIRIIREDVKDEQGNEYDCFFKFRAENADCRFACECGDKICQLCADLVIKIRG